MVDHLAPGTSTNKAPAASADDIKAAADILCAAYGEEALERARLLEARMPSSVFAEGVRAEIERRPIRAAPSGRFAQARQ